MVGTRGNRTVHQSVGFAIGACEEERWTDEMGDKSKRVENTDGYGQLSVEEYSRNNS